MTPLNEHAGGGSEGEGTAQGGSAVLYEPLANVPTEEWWTSTEHKIKTTLVVRRAYSTRYSTGSESAAKIATRQNHRLGCDRSGLCSFSSEYLVPLPFLPTC